MCAAAMHSVNQMKPAQSTNRTVTRVMTPTPLFQATPQRDKIQPRKRALSETDAIDIWIARWLRIRRKDIVQRYGCDPRRIYEIWEGVKHPAARSKALERFRDEYPSLLDRVDFGSHQRIPRSETSPDQLVLFDFDGRPR